MASRPMPAVAGDPGDWDPEQRRAERAARTWRQQGIEALPRVLAALRSGDSWLEDEARDVLRGWGARVVQPLLLRGARAHDAGEPLVLVAEILCRVGRPSRDDDGDGGPLAPGRSDRRAEARAARAVAVAERPLLSALGSGDRALADAGLEVLASVTTRDECPNRALLADRAATATLTLILAKPDSELPPENVGLLSGLGTKATPALTRVRRWLDDPRLSEPATRLLAAMGPSALPALPALTARLDAMARRGCVPDGWLAAATARAVGALGGAGDAGAPAASALLQRTLRACPAIEEPVIDAIGEMGPRGASAAPAMQAILRDRERPPKLRALTATALHRLAVPRNAGDQAIEVALENKEAIRAGRHSRLPLGPQVQTTDLSLAGGAVSPRERTAARVRLATIAVTEEAAICRAEAALDPPTDAFARAVADRPDPAALEALASCLQQHTCGPASSDRDRTIDACCRRAFGSSLPAWCRPSPEPPADY